MKFKRRFFPCLRSNLDLKPFVEAELSLEEVRIKRFVSKQINLIDLLLNALQIGRTSQFIGILGVTVRSN